MEDVVLTVVESRTALGVQATVFMNNSYPCQCSHSSVGSTEDREWLASTERAILSVKCFMPHLWRMVSDLRTKDLHYFVILHWSTPVPSTAVFSYVIQSCPLHSQD